MSPRIPMTLLVTASMLWLNACGESDEASSPDATPLTDAAQSASQAAEDAATDAQSSTEDATSQDERSAGETAINDYITGMEELNSIARSITDKLSAASKTPEAKAALDKVKEAWTALDELNPELKQQLTQLSKPKLDALSSTLTSEAERIADELGLPDLASMLNEAPSLTEG